MSHSQPGISVIICCYNSSQRIVPTLEHLQACTVNADVEWEVIIIDNASTDNTATTAEQHWQKSAVAPLRIIREETPGLSHARKRGLKESTYAVLAFIDDDNWVNPNWLNQVKTIFDQTPPITAAGGPIVEVCESTPPSWFEAHKGNFTIWAPQQHAGTWKRPLCGAGLCIRKEAWLTLNAQGFKSCLIDREGSNLSSGGDFELAYALLLAGHTLWYDPGLEIKHFLPQERVRWNYLKRLNQGFGQQSIFLEAYEKVLANEAAAPSWLKEFTVSCLRVVKGLPLLLTNKFKEQEGNADIIFLEGQIGRLKALWKEQSQYESRFTEIANAQWKKAAHN